MSVSKILQVSFLFIIVFYQSCSSQKEDVPMPILPPSQEEVKNEIQDTLETDLEVEALKALYAATDGDNWDNNTNWLSDKPLTQWYGIETKGSEDRIYSIKLSNNNLKGKIPTEIGNLKDLEYLWLDNNELTGTIPDTIFQLKNLKWLYLQENSLEGELPQNVSMPALEVLYLNNNLLTGNLSTSWIYLNNLRDFRLFNNKLSGIITEEIATSDAWLHRWPVEMIYYQQEGYGFEKYTSTDFSKDGTILTLQTHSKGNGIKIVLTGDGFSDRLINNGYFEEEMKEAMELFFLKEPFKTFREYFDIYAYVAVSENEVIGENTAWGFKIDTKTFLPIYDYKRDQKLHATLTEHQLFKNEKSMVIARILNSNTNFGGLSSLGCEGTWAIGYTDKHHDYGLLFVHEINGHGFGGLEDEDAYDNSTMSELGKNNIKISHSRGNCLNVDVTNNPDSVLWSAFLKDERYISEGLGIVEGACGVKKGVYRSGGKGGIMRGDLSLTATFNAPSRWAIYQRIMRLAGEEYSFESFLEYDAINRVYYDSISTN